MKTLYIKYNRITSGIIPVLIILLAIYLSFKYFLHLIAPFAAGAIIAAVNEPVISFLENKLRLPRSASAALSLLLTIIVLLIIATLSIFKIYNELVFLKQNISHHLNDISHEFDKLLSRLTEYYNSLPSGISNAADEALRNQVPKLQERLTGIIGSLLNAIKSIPRVIIFTVMTLLSAYFISSDRRRLRGYFYKSLPSSWSRNIVWVKSDTLKALLGYFKAMLILMIFTFIQFCIGLAIIGSDYVLIMSLLIALTDAIPIFGTGIIMVPWTLWNILTGNITKAAGLSVIYLTGIIIRQFLEPKIVGSHIGLHPLATLAAMYLGLELFGPLGLLFGPICMIILKSVYHAGVSGVKS